MLTWGKTGIILAYGTGKSIKSDNMLCYNITLGIYRGCNG